MEKTLDETYADYMDTMFMHSEPGATLHSLYVAERTVRDVDPFGRADPSKLKLTIAAMALPEEQIPLMIMKIGTDAVKDGLIIEFMGIALECNALEGDAVLSTDEVREAKKLKKERRLDEHAKAIEVTRLYAAARDGRRWTGTRVLTGRNAGKAEGPMLRSGALSEDETGTLPKTIRRSVML